MAHDPGADLHELSRRAVSDQCSTSSGKANVRAKLAIAMYLLKSRVSLYVKPPIRQGKEHAI